MTTNDNNYQQRIGDAYEQSGDKNPISSGGYRSNLSQIKPNIARILDQKAVTPLYERTKNIGGKHKEGENKDLVINAAGFGVFAGLAKDFLYDSEIMGGMVKDPAVIEAVNKIHQAQSKLNPPWGIDTYSGVYHNIMPTDLRTALNQYEQATVNHMIHTEIPGAAKTALLVGTVLLAAGYAYKNREEIPKGLAKISKKLQAAYEPITKA